MPKDRILVHGPSELLAEIFAGDLASLGYEVGVAENLEDLERRASTEGYPVVVLCLFPNGQRALEVAQSLRLGRSDPPALVFLGLDEDHRRQARSLSGAVYQEIPYALSDLEEMLGRLTRQAPVILLVDDSRLVHEHTGGILRDAGYDVLEAFDGKEGLALVRSEHPDLVITDIQMPELDGYGLCRAIKEDPRTEDIPVLICSALGETPDLEAGFEAGADDYLVKPADPVDLLGRIQALLGRIRAARERILVVDDSAPVRRLVSDSLARQGFAVTTAKNGKEGYEKAVATRPDLVITDYDMPEWSGFQLVHALKKNPETADIPVMMLTARHGERDRAKMRAVGLSSYLVKPFSADKCVAVVERLLAERRLQAYRRASELYLSAGTVQAAALQAATGQVGSVRAREQVLSILFVDLCGFTPLSAERAPGDVVALLNEYFDRVCPAILEHGGDIDKLIGDAVMAVFEDADTEPSAVRAVWAGLAVQEALAAWRAESGEPVHARVGINTGRVVRGDLGSRHFRRDYTVIGDAVNRAQRLESLAPRDSVLVSEETFRRTEGLFRGQRIEGLRLKGVEEPVAAYLVEGPAHDTSNTMEMGGEAP